MSTTYQVSGMKCDGCAKTVQEKLSAVKGVKSAQVDLAKNQVTIEGKPWMLSLKRALKGTKYQLGGEV
ncbi:copper chaperone CopZ [Streptococcus sobrinus]|uniref:copper chaperone CopZ n=1 Tax=Streptococcus sobrinus TaxID=1310 RepID=UPI00031781A3|nr:copper chaperone CopZ [Streptococcus sobrinus]